MNQIPVQSVYITFRFAFTKNCFFDIIQKNIKIIRTYGLHSRTQSENRWKKMIVLLFCYTFDLKKLEKYGWVNIVHFLSRKVEKTVYRVGSE